MKLAVIRKNVKTPTRGTKGSAGIDFYLPSDYESIIIQPTESICIPSGIKVELPKNTALIANNKSSMGKLGLIVGASVVDEDYTGEIHINLWNVSNHSIVLVANQKIVQFILTPVIYDFEVVDINELHTTPTERGNGGFGSTESIKNNQNL